MRRRYGGSSRGGVHARSTVAEPVIEPRADRFGARRGSARDGRAINIRCAGVMRGGAVASGRARGADARLAGLTRRARAAPEFEWPVAAAQRQRKDGRQSKFRPSDHSLTLR
jgi:hypothetical protein